MIHQRTSTGWSGEAVDNTGDYQGEQPERFDNYKMPRQSQHHQHQQYQHTAPPDTRGSSAYANASSARALPEDVRPPSGGGGGYGDRGGGPSASTGTGALGRDARGAGGASPSAPLLGGTGTGTGSRAGLGGTTGMESTSRRTATAALDALQDKITRLEEDREALSRQLEEQRRELQDKAQRDLSLANVKINYLTNQISSLQQGNIPPDPPDQTSIPLSGASSLSNTTEGEATQGVRDVEIESLRREIDLLVSMVKHCLDCRTPPQTEPTTLREAPKNKAIPQMSPTLSPQSTSKMYISPSRNPGQTQLPHRRSPTKVTEVCDPAMESHSRSLHTSQHLSSHSHRHHSNKISLTTSIPFIGMSKSSSTHSLPLQLQKVMHLLKQCDQTGPYASQNGTHTQVLYKRPATAPPQYQSLSRKKESSPHLTQRPSTMASSHTPPQCSGCLSCRHTEYDTLTYAHHTNRSGGNCECTSGSSERGNTTTSSNVDDDGDYSDEATTTTTMPVATCDLSELEDFSDNDLARVLQSLEADYATLGNAINNSSTLCHSQRHTLTPDVLSHYEHTGTVITLLHKYWELRCKSKQAQTQALSQSTPQVSPGPTTAPQVSTVPSEREPLPRHHHPGCYYHQSRNNSLPRSSPTSPTTSSTKNVLRVHKTSP